MSLKLIKYFFLGNKLTFNRIYPIIIIILTIIISININALDKKNYKILPDYQLDYLNLRELIILRAEIYAARGYLFKSIFLQREMKKRSWYNPSNYFSYSDLTKKEIIYINKITKRINSLKKIELDTKISQLKNYLSGQMIIKFTQLADFDNNGYFKLVAICAKPYKIDKKDIKNEASYNYYHGNNDLYLILWGDSSTVATRITNPFIGTAEYLNAFDIGYFMNNGIPQVKIIIHTLPLTHTNNAVHREYVYLYNLEDERWNKVFNYQIYQSYSSGGIEKIIQYTIQFKDIYGSSMNEIILQKYLTTRVYKRTANIYSNYKSSVYKYKPVYFKYNNYKKSYQPVYFKN